MRARVVRATLLAVLMPVAAGAQSVPITAVPMTEAEALARLSAGSPRVRAIRASIDVARADVLNAARWPNPRLMVNREATAGVAETMTTVQQPLPVTGRRAFERDAAVAMVEASTRHADEAVRRLRADLRLAYADLVTAQVRERELTRSRDRLQLLTGILQRREAAGDTAGFDRLRSEREVIDVEADRATAASDRAHAQAVLAGFFASTEPAALAAVEPAVGPIDVPPVDALMDEASRVRGDILALQQEIASARLSVRAADRRRVPEPELMAGTKSSTDRGGDIGSVIAVQAVLPLFDRGRPERALAEAHAVQTQARLDALRLTVRAEIAAWRAAALDRRNAAARYRETALATASEVERIAQVSYDAGDRTILELLDAYRTSASARIRLTTLDAAARHAEIELEYASGWEVR